MSDTPRTERDRLVEARAEAEKAWDEACKAVDEAYKACDEAIAAWRESRKALNDYDAQQGGEG